MLGKKANAFVALIFMVLSPKWIAAKESFSAEELAFFESKVRPLLSERCYDCHSHKAKKLKGASSRSAP